MRPDALGKAHGKSHAMSTEMPSWFSADALPIAIASFAGVMYIALVFSRLITSPFRSGSTNDVFR
jgi:hypothetical protein